MWKASKVDPLHLEYFNFAGRVIALALMHKVQIGIVFDRVFFLQLAGSDISLDDIKDADPYLHSSCKQILDMGPFTVDQDALGLTFVQEIEELGSMKVVELFPNGKNIMVNSRNRKEYVELLIQHRFVTSVTEQVKHFAQGFADIVVEENIQQLFFKSLELEDLDGMLQGSESIISLTDWKVHTEYNGYKETDPQIRWFWKAKDKLEKSMVADNESGKSIESEVRTSSGMFLSKAQDEVVAGIESRIFAWTFLPVENGESMQILHYENGQKYERHWDYFHDKANQALGGHRIATVLMYLSNVKKGGETVFPGSEIKESQPKANEDWSDCAKEGYAVKPRKGDALLFFSLHPNATTDVLSLHGSCPVIEGEKWSATKWIHVRNFDKADTASDGCMDENINCPVWAASGECVKNPVYMVGSADGTGNCRKSCKVC